VKRTLGALLSVVLLAGAFAACAGGAASPGPGPTSSALREAWTILQQSRAKATAQLVVRDAKLERSAWKLAGFETALGGAAQADAAFAHASEAARTAQESRRANPVAIAPASLRADVAEGFAGGLVGSAAVTALDVANVIGATADGTVGSTTTARDGLTTTLSSAPDGTLGVDSVFTVAKDGVETKIIAQHEFDTCPAADGSVTVTSHLEVGAAAGSASTWVTVELTTHVQAAGDAGLDGVAYGYQAEAGYADGTTRRSVTFRLDADGGGENLAQTGDVDAGFASAAGTAGALAAGLTARTLGDMVAKGWQHPGRCVDLGVTASKGPTGLDPGDRVTLTAKPVAKRDGKPAGGTVEATLAGAKSLDPSGTRVKADATFQYTAPDERKGGGTVALTSRSNRGVGEADVTLSVGQKAFTLNGSEGDFTYSGRACDLAQPFTVTATAIETLWTMSFTPTSASGGSYTLSGTTDVATVDGGGTYTVDAAGGTITTTGSVNFHAAIGFSKPWVIHIPMQPTTC
jgi:hypothetical protein